MRPLDIAHVSFRPDGRLMARLQCRSCGLDRDVERAVDLRCPGCGSSDVRAAVAVDEMPEESFERLRRAVADGEDGDIADGA